MFLCVFYFLPKFDFFVNEENSTGRYCKGAKNLLECCKTTRVTWKIHNWFVNKAKNKTQESPNIGILCTYLLCRSDDFLN